MKHVLLGLVAFCVLTHAVRAQTRYLDEVFSQVSITQDVMYGTNYSVMTGTPILTQLMMDVYEPMGDTASARPVVLFAHSGNFLPRIVNGTPIGTRWDSAVVEICTRLAKMGYVAIAYSYRQGWNPITVDVNSRTATLLHANVRAIQDTRNVVRFLRAHTHRGSNDLRVDPDKIAVGGAGYGGWVALGTAYLHDFNELFLPRFFFSDSVPPIPYVDPVLFGNLSGTQAAPWNFPNYPGYGSEVHFAFSMGGALIDTSWLQAGEPPCVAFHTTMDPLIPYLSGPIVQHPGSLLIEVSGSYDLVRKANELGNNAPFLAANFSDGYTSAANRLNDGYEGLFPFDRPYVPGLVDCADSSTTLYTWPESAPWDWWDEAAFISDWNAVPGQSVPGALANCNALTMNLDMSPEKGRRYIDSIIGYLAPRMALALSSPATTHLDSELAEQSLQVFPNPSRGNVQLRLRDEALKITEIEVLDEVGRVVLSRKSLYVQEYTLAKTSLSSGLYLLRIRSANGSYVTRKLRID